MLKINNKILVALLIVLFYFLISANSIFPKGIFFASGDTEQIINFKNFFYKRSGVWDYLELGRTNNNYFSNFYYNFIYFFLDLFNLPENYSIFFLKFTYLFFSFLSFYFSLNILKLNINFNSRLLLSAAYSINFYTFYIFWYTWGYATTHFYYIFAPILFSSSIYFTYEDDIRIKLKFLINLIPIFFLSNLAFSNLAWVMISLVIFLFVALYKLITDPNALNYKTIIKELIFFSVFSTLFLIFVFGSILLQIISVQESMTLSNSAELISWITSQAQNLPSAFFFISVYKYLDTMNGFHFFSIFNFFIIFYLLWKNGIQLKLVKLLLIFNIFIILITFKAKFILPDFIIEKIFYDSLFYGFRSEDKSSLLLAYSALTLIAFLIINQKKNQTKITLIVFLLNLLSAYPLVTGGINYSHGINISKTEISNYQSLKKIDNDLLKFQELTSSNKDNDIYNIIEVPFFITISAGWYNFPNSSHLGVSYYNQFTNMQLIGFNSSEYLLGNLVIPFWSSRSENSNWDINIMNTLSAKYILNHKLAPRTDYNNTNKKLDDLVNKKIINKIYTGEGIDLYEIKKQYLNKKIYIPETVIENCIMKYDANRKLIPTDIKTKTAFTLNKCNLDISFILENIEKKDQNNYTIYQKPADSELSNIIYNKEIKNFTFEGVNLKENFFIVFTQQFNQLWELKCKNCKNDQEIKHIKINNSMNGWIINKNNQDKLEFSIYFKLENYIRIYLFFLIAIFLSSIWIKRKFLN